MRQILTLIVLFSSFAFGQDDVYRFHFFAGLNSIVNWGEKELNGVYQPSDAYSKYLSETYDVQYKKNNYSPGLVVGFGFDWVSKEKFVLRQEVSLFGNSVTEQINFEIVDIGNGDTTGRDDYSTNQVNVGYKNRVVGIGKSIGTKIGILGIYKRDKLNLGLGFNWTRRFSEDLFYYGRGYNPWSHGRQTMNYLTHQLDADFRIEYCFGRWSTFFNCSQKFVTLKKEKGARYFDETVDVYPFSHNLDFRFPTTFTLGIQLNFKRIN